MLFGQVWLCQKDGCTCSQFQLLLSKDHEFCMQVVKKTIPNNSQPHLWNRFDSSKKSGRILLKMFKTRSFKENVSAALESMQVRWFCIIIVANVCLAMHCHKLLLPCHRFTTECFLLCLGEFRSSSVEYFEEIVSFCSHALMNVSLK